MCCIYRTENYKDHFKIVGQIIFKKKKRMAWQLIWCNVRAVVLNATLQLLVIYRSAILCLSIFYSFLRIYFRLIIFCVFFYNSTLVDWCCDFGNSHHKFSLFIVFFFFFFEIDILFI